MTVVSVLLSLVARGSVVTEGLSVVATGASLSSRKIGMVEGISKTTLAKVCATSPVRLNRSVDSTISSSMKVRSKQSLGMVNVC